MPLQIEYDPAVPSDIAAQVPTWMEDVMAWSLNQPRPADLTGQQPRFTEVRYSIAMDAWNHGLTRRSTGAGWMALGVSSDVVIETRPRVTIIPSTVDVGSRSRWVYVLSQLFRPESYTDDNFRWREHFDYQLRYLEEIAPDIAAEAQAKIATVEAEEKHKRYLAQFSEKRKLKQQAQAEVRRIKPPEWYTAKYPPPCKDAPPPFQAAPVPPPTIHPEPVLSEADKRALEIIEQQNNYMLSYCSTEDFDK